MSIVIQSLADDDRVLQQCCTFLNFLQVFSFMFLVECETTLRHLHMHTHVTYTKVFSELFCKCTDKTRRINLVFSPICSPSPSHFHQSFIFSAMYRILNPFYCMLKRSFMQRFLGGFLNTIMTLWYPI